MEKHKKFYKLGIISILFLGSISLFALEKAKNWATPIKSEKIENFFKVSEKIYRSAQPGAEGFKELEKLDLTNIINLRQFHSDNDEAKNCKVQLYRIKINAGDIKEKDIVSALKIIKNAKGKVLVHCWHGSDRTGVVIAMYRIVFQNWTKNEALNELLNGGFGYHSIYENIPEFIKNANVEKIKKAVYKN